MFSALAAFFLFEKREEEGKKLRQHSHVARSVHTILKPFWGLSRVFFAAQNDEAFHCEPPLWIYLRVRNTLHSAFSNEIVTFNPIWEERKLLPIRGMPKFASLLRLRGEICRAPKLTRKQARR